MDTAKTVNTNNSHTHDGEGLVVKSQLEPLTISANSNNIGGGPPTPTHSENQDGIDIRKGEWCHSLYNTDLLIIYIFLDFRMSVSNTHEAQQILFPLPVSEFKIGVLNCENVHHFKSIF